jgi:nucleoside-diphosphate-sugar epimerase
MLSEASHVVQEDLKYICRNLEKELGALGGKNLLITGGAGFLGYYLVQAALEYNSTADIDSTIKVTVYDNFMRGVPEWLKAKQGSPFLSIVKRDITESLPLDMPDMNYLIHAASIASPIFYRRYPIETMDANVNGLRSLLEYCRSQIRKEKPIEGFLFFSTSEVYGDPTPENIPTPETYRGNVSCTGPRACYDESKRYGEAMCVNFSQQYGLPVKVARPFNNYGPGLKISDRRVLPDFCRDIFSGRDIVMHSDGLPTRTFCYVADAIVGYYKILVSGKAGESYNIGVESPEISMKALAELVTRLARERFGYKGQVIKRASTDANYLVDNPNRRCPVIAKARNDLGYNPQVSLEEGLLRTLIWYSENREAEDA